MHLARQRPDAAANAWDLRVSAFLEASNYILLQPFRCKWVALLGCVNRMMHTETWPFAPWKVRNCYRSKEPSRSEAR
ncbi:hypothetical protein BDA96_03G371300 [Sorghum bicolor]|uniref:Uncharacterized protein n=1 Tax=Sorghum bicolor TaxID=4558 RepID=A0A921RHY7_SORBI|nr:hypothetical protein BDA96_03G371300 [Sorghum bicolor]